MSFGGKNFGYKLQFSDHEPTEYAHVQGGNRGDGDDTYAECLLPRRDSKNSSTSRHHQHDDSEHYGEIYIPTNGGFADDMYQAVGMEHHKMLEIATPKAYDPKQHEAMFSARPMDRSGPGPRDNSGRPPNRNPSFTPAEQLQMFRNQQQQNQWPGQQHQPEIAEFQASDDPSFNMQGILAKPGGYQQSQQNDQTSSRMVTGSASSSSHQVAAPRRLTKDSLSSDDGMSSDSPNEAPNLIQEYPNQMPINDPNQFSKLSHQAERAIEYFDPIKDGQSSSNALSGFGNANDTNNSFNITKQNDNSKIGFQDDFANFQDKFEQPSLNHKGSFSNQAKTQIQTAPNNSTYLNMDDGYAKDAPPAPAPRRSIVLNKPDDRKPSTVVSAVQMGNGSFNLHAQSQMLQQFNQQNQQFQQQQMNQQLGRIRVQLPRKDKSPESSDDENVPGGHIGPTFTQSPTSQPVMQHMTSQNATPQHVTQPVMSHSFSQPQHITQPSFAPTFNQLNFAGRNINSGQAYQNSGYSGPGAVSMSAPSFEGRKFSSVEANNGYDPTRFESPSMPTNTSTPLQHKTSTSSLPSSCGGGGVGVGSPMFTTQPSEAAMSVHNLPGGYVPLEDLWDKPYFNMRITLKEAEDILRNQKKEGHYVVRNSRSKDGLNFAITFYSKRVENTVRHLNITFIPQTKQWRLGKQERESELRFSKVTECIEHYLKNGFVLENGVEIKLVKPIKSGQKEEKFNLKKFLTK